MPAVALSSPAIQPGDSQSFPSLVLGVLAQVPHVTVVLSPERELRFDELAVGEVALPSHHHCTPATSLVMSRDRGRPPCRWVALGDAFASKRRARAGDHEQRAHDRPRSKLGGRSAGLGLGRARIGGGRRLGRDRGADQRSGARRPRPSPAAAGAEHRHAQQGDQSTAQRHGARRAPGLGACRGAPVLRLVHLDHAGTGAAGIGVPASPPLLPEPQIERRDDEQVQQGRRDETAEDHPGHRVLDLPAGDLAGDEQQYEREPARQHRHHDRHQCAHGRLQHQIRPARTPSNRSRC